MRVLALIIAVLPTFVNAAMKDPFQMEALALTEQLSTTGEKDTMRSGRARLLDIPEGTAIRFKEVAAEETTDDKTRSCELVYDSSGTMKRMCILLRVNQDTPKMGKSDTFYFRLDPKGRLERIIFSVMELDEAGRVVRGSGKFEDKEQSPELMKMLRKELDFWLKGKYRKKVVAKPAKPAAKTQ